MTQTAADADALDLYAELNDLDTLLPEPVAAAEVPALPRQDLTTLASSPAIPTFQPTSTLSGYISCHLFFPNSIRKISVQGMSLNTAECISLCLVDLFLLIYVG